MSSNFFVIFSSIPLREFLISFLRVSNILLKLFFRSFSSASSIFGCSGFAVVGSLGFSGVVYVLTFSTHLFL